MLFDALLALDLPATLGPPLPTPLLEGLEQWLFEGRWHRRRATCTLSAGVVLARCLGALREVGPFELALRSDAEELVELPLASPSWGEPPASWPERLPPRWTTQPCDFALSASRVVDHASEAVHLRFQPRHVREAGGLVAAVRVAWSVPPREDQAATQRDLAHTLRGARELRDLEDRTERRGERLAEALARALESRFGTGRASWQGRVVLAHGLSEAPERFDDLLAGLSDDARHLCAGVEGLAAATRAEFAAVDERGIPGRLRGGTFTPNTLQERTDAL